MNTIHRKPGSFDSILTVPALGEIDHGRKKPSDEELLFDIASLTIQQVATWDQVCTKSIYRWIKAGKIGKRTYQKRLLEMQWTNTMLMQCSDGTAL